MTAPDDPAAVRAGALLTVDLAAVKANYRRLLKELGGVACAAVVKADAYGLGIDRLAPALAEAGAEIFFVAQLDEAVALRAILASRPDAKVCVLNGLMRGAESDYRAHDVVPVLNSLDDIGRWRDLAKGEGRALEAMLHVDTGMSRLGLPRAELDTLADDHTLLDGIRVSHLMSHLACADEPAHPLNARQREDFETARRRLPPCPACFANSSGIFLGPAYHFDLARPGVALYGVNPRPGQPNPMSQVVRLQGKILQTREIDAPDTVGYGATFRASGPLRLATVAVGYADGYLRSLSNRGVGFIAGEPVPLVGRVSMDLITFDVSAVPERDCRPGATIDIFDPGRGVDALAEQAGTIGYEVLTSLGRRYHRVYENA